MGAIPSYLLQHSIVVEPLIGQYSQGPAYGDPVTHKKCFVSDQTTLQRDRDGQEVVSSAIVIMPLDSDIPLDSRVTVNGRETTVLNVKRNVGGKGLTDSRPLEGYPPMSYTLDWNGDRIAATIDKQSDAGVEKALKHLLRISQSQVPYRKGRLKESGRVVPPNTGGGKVEYGGKPSRGVIAVVQHERLKFKHPVGGNAKYLERPMITEARAMLNLIANEVKLS